MSNDTIKDAEIRKTEYKKEYEALDKEKNGLLEQGRQINKRLSEINTRQVFLNGAYAENEKVVPTVKIGGDAKVARTP